MYFECRRSVVWLLPECLPVIIEIHSCCIPAYSKCIREILTGFEVPYQFMFHLECNQNISNAVGMHKEHLECSRNAFRVHLECRSILFHLESTWKVLNMFKTFVADTGIGPNIWNALRMQLELEEITSNCQEYTSNFHSNSILVHSNASVTGV